MGSYDASLKALGDLHGLPAVVRLEDGWLTIDAGDTHIGGWSLDEISLEPAPNGYRMAADGDQILLELTDVERFAEELAPQDDGRRARRQADKRAKAEAKRRPGPEAEAEADRRAGAEAERRARTQADQQARAQAEQRAQAERRAEVDRRAGAGADQRAEADQRARARAERRARAEAEQRARAEAERREMAARADERDAAPPSTSKARRPKKPGKAAGAREQREKDRPNRLDEALNAAEERWGDRLPSWAFTRGTLTSTLIVLLLAAVLPGLVSNILLICGVVIVLYGAVVFTDPMLAARWLPNRVVPSHVLLTGAAVLVLGVILAVATG